MKRLKFILIVFLILTAIGCKERGKKSGKSEVLKEVSIRQEWIPNSNYAGVIMAQKLFANDNGIDLKIEAGSDVNPVMMVIQDHNTFGDASADKIILANSKGADLVVIGVINRISPTCFIAKKEAKIFTPKDFIGKTVGILTGTNTEYVYKDLLKKEGIDPASINHIEAPFDVRSFIISDDYDVRPAFIYDEPVSLDLHGIEYTIIEPKNYGVKFLGTVYFTRKKTIEESPELVQDFINSVADGWKAALVYPDQAISYLAEYDKKVDPEREILALKKSFKYFDWNNDKVLWADLEDWQVMVESLIDLKLIDSVDLPEMIDNSFLLKYYSENK